MIFCCHNILVVGISLKTQSEAQNGKGKMYQVQRTNLSQDKPENGIQAAYLGCFYPKEKALVAI